MPHHPRPRPLPLKRFSNSSNAPSTDLSTPSTPRRLRAQLNHLIPKHTYFRARVHIHQIDSVPFVNGQFSVRWKFKNVHSPPGPRHNRPKHGLLAIVKTRSKAGNANSAKSTTDNVEVESVASSNSNELSVPSVVVSHNDHDDQGQEQGLTLRNRVPSFSGSISSSGSSSLQALPQQDTHSEPLLLASHTYHHQNSLSTNQANGSHSALHLPLATLPLTTSSSQLSSAHLPLSPSSSSTPLFSPTPTPTPTPAPSSHSHSQTQTPAKGSTPFLELKDHSVHWDQPLHTVLRLDVERDTAALLPCPFKLVVMQHQDTSVPQDSSRTPRNPRLGAVYLNLAEYVGQGTVQRRYLLRESRTNATLKLTIELDYLAGETHYIPPPLPKGEILNGLAGYLSGELNHLNKHRSLLRPAPTRVVHLTGYGFGYGYPEYPDIYLDKRRKERKGEENSEDEDAEMEDAEPGTKESAVRLQRPKSTPKLKLKEAWQGTDSYIYGQEDESDFDSENSEFYSANEHENYENNNNDLDDNDGNDPSELITQISPTESLPSLSPSYSAEMKMNPVKMTECLIEAIFNPVTTNEKRRDSPFTIYVPGPTPRHTFGRGSSRSPARLSATNGREEAKEQREDASVYSYESGAAAEGSTCSHQSHHSKQSHSGISLRSKSDSNHSNSGSTADSKDSGTGAGTSESGSERKGRGGGKPMKDWWRKVSSPITNVTPISGSASLPLSAATTPAPATATHTAPMSAATTLTSTPRTLTPLSATPVSAAPSLSITRSKTPLTSAI